MSVLRNHVSVALLIVLIDGDKCIPMTLEVSVVGVNLQPARQKAYRDSCWLIEIKELNYV
jgi:hypothetical protein